MEMRTAQRAATERPAGGRTARRASPDEAFAAAIELASRGSGRFKRHARRYSMCAADAEDAYQRSLEILLTKAPTADRGELQAWLHTVIKHEALALRRQRERALAGGDPDTRPEARDAIAPALDEQASGRERVRLTAEALGHLKQSELQCLLLKATGYSYDEIAARTGYSWTKVNRSLTEGRRRFLECFGRLVTGEACGDMAPLLSAAADGEATKDEERRLAVHLRSCGSCRAALRGYRAAPGRLAELVPPGLLLPLVQQASWWSRLGEWVSGGTGDRAGALAWKLQQSAEALGAQKATAVVASSAALAGGAAVHAHAPLHAHHGIEARARAAVSAAAAQPAPAAAPVPAPPPAPAPAAESAPAAAGDAARAGSQLEPGGEFAPGGAPAAAPAAAQASAAAVRYGGGEFGGPGAAAGAGGGEFGP